MDEYQIKLAAFEGPMALLMHLIDKNKIDIYDIPIAELTGQYMEYLDGFRKFNIEIASSFLVMAATLLQIKSRMMLPREPKEDGEEEEEDPRADLARRLLEYKQFQEVSNILAEMASFQEKFFARAPAEVPTKRTAPKELPLELLVEAFKKVLKGKAELFVPEVIVRPEEYSIKDKMTDIMKSLSGQNRLYFDDLFADGATKTELIALFLALLELIKLKQVTVKQNDIFGDIAIMPTTI